MMVMIKEVGKVMDVIEYADLLVYMEVGEVTKEVKKVDQ